MQLRTLLVVISALLAGSVITDWLSSKRFFLFSDQYAMMGEDADLAGGRRSSIGKVMMLYGNPTPVYERALKGHSRHNEKHGYSMHVLREQTLSEFWSKPAYILQVLLAELAKPAPERLKWLVCVSLNLLRTFQADFPVHALSWLDGDLVIMNPNIPLEIFLPPEPEWSHINALVTNDHHGLNNGVFFLRVNEWSVWLMAATVAWKIYKPDVPLRFHDQTALGYLLDTDDFRNATMHVPQRWFNAYTGYRGEGHPDPLKPQTKFRKNSVKEGDVLAHFAGHPRVRAERMAIWLDVVDKHLPTWEMPLEKTGYLEEIDKFWKKDAKLEAKRAKSGKPF